MVQTILLRACAVFSLLRNPIAAFILAGCALIGFAGCGPGRIAEYDRLVESGDYEQAKQLMQKLIDEYSLRDENPTLPLRRAQAYYWLGHAHGHLGEYEDMKVALLMSLSNDDSFEDPRIEMLQEFSLECYNRGVAAYNDGRYAEADAEFKKALVIIEGEAYPELRARILRNRACSDILAGNTDGASDALMREAAALGDPLAKDLLTGARMVPRRIDPGSHDLYEDTPTPPGLETPPDSVKSVITPPPMESDSRNQESFSTSARMNPAWTLHTVSSDEIEELPMRGTERYLPLFSGVSDVNGGLHFRGSRTGETGYLLEGSSVLNPFYNTNGVPLIPEAIERLELHTGAYEANMGSAGGGIVVSRMKRGGEDLSGSFRVESDDFAKPGGQFLGTSAFGYRNIAGTVSGSLPIPGFDLRFFLAGEYDYARNRQPMFLDPFRYVLVTDDKGSYPSDIQLPGPVEFSRNHLPNNWLERTTLQGNATFSLGVADFLVTGSYNHEVMPDGSQWPTALRRFFVQRRNPLDKRTTRFGSLVANIHPGPSTDIELLFSLYDHYRRVYDPDFKHNFRAYTDSLSNAQLGYHGFTSRFSPPPGYSTIFDFFFEHPSTPSNTYKKENQFSWTLVGKLSQRILSEWQIEAGGNVSFWTMRYYHMNNVRLFRSNEIYAFYPNEESKRRGLMQSVRLAGYQYDNPSLEVEGLDGPVKPTYGALYVQNLLAYHPAVISVGFRYELIDPNLIAVPQTLNPVTALYDYQEPPFDDNLLLLEPEALTKSPVYSYLLPRIGLTISFSDETTARVAYGVYAQMHNISDLHMDQVALSARMNPFFRQPYNLGGPSVTFLAEPERSTHFEIGVRQEFGPGMVADMVYYQKSLDNQLQLERVSNSQGTPIFVALRNGGKAISTGLEVALNTEIQGRYSGRLSYAFSETKGRLSDPFDWRYVSDFASFALFPESLELLDYDQTHRATLSGTVRFGAQDGPLLEYTSLSLLITVRSGQRYTALRDPVNLGGSTPWNIGVTMLQDARLPVPESAENELTGPWFINTDLRLTKAFEVSFTTIEVVLDVLNLFDRRHVLNVFPTTGSPDADGWFLSPMSDGFKAFPLYEEFYTMINLQNRWAYMGVTGNDMYGSPRQIRLGVKVGM